MRMHAHTPSPAENQSAESIHSASKRQLSQGVQALVLVAGCKSLLGEMLLAGPSRAANQLPACCYKDVGGAPAALGTGSP